jgi:hypothetical protein
MSFSKTQVLSMIWIEIHKTKKKKKKKFKPHVPISYLAVIFKMNAWNKEKKNPNILNNMSQNG